MTIPSPELLLVLALTFAPESSLAFVPGPGPELAPVLALALALSLALASKEFSCTTNASNRDSDHTGKIFASFMGTIIGVNNMVVFLLLIDFSHRIII